MVRTTILVKKSDLNFVLGGRGKNLVKAVSMSENCWLDANSVQKHVKKGRCPKAIWPGLQPQETGDISNTNVSVK